MKKIIIFLVCLLVIIIAGLFCLYFGGGKNYINNNIPSQYKYTQSNLIIPDELAMPRVKKQIGDSMEYLAGEEYDNQYFYQDNGTIYCRDDNETPEIITYYSRRPAGYWIFTKMGGYSSRGVFTCGDKYFINDFDSSQGGNIYGPFSEIEDYCTSFGEVCPQNDNRCESCGITKVSNYASCHSKEFCANTPVE